MKGHIREFMKRVHLLLGLYMLSGCASTSPNTQLPIPLPINALDVHQGTMLGGYRFLSFSTNEEAASILTFYRQNLPNAGWKYRVYDSSDGIVYSPSMITLGKRHVLNIFVQKQHDGSIHVTIREADE